MSRWPMVSLAELCVEVDERQGARDYPVYSVSKNHGIIPQAQRFKKRIASENTNRYKVIEPGDFAFDPMLLWSGSVARNDTGHTGVVSPAYTVFRAKPDIRPELLLAFLRQEARLTFYESISFGTNARRRKAHFKDFIKLEMPLPPVSEQERIVQLFDEANVIRRLRAQANQRTADLIPALFHGMFGDPATNPMGWPVLPLGELISLEARLVDPREDNHQQLPHIGADKIESGSGALLPAQTAAQDQLISAKFLFDDRDVLYSKIRPNLRKAALPDSRGLCSADVYPLRAGPALVREYLWSYLLSDYFTSCALRLSARANMPKLNRRQLESIACPVPPLMLQREYAEQTRRIRALKIHQARNRDKLGQVYESLINRVFSNSGVV